MRTAIHARRADLALLLLYALLYVLPLGVRPLTSPDEVRYGQISREMLATGDFVAPHFNGVRYFEKPVLGYWLNSASMKLLGETAFALRLPVALATALTALVLYALARRFATLFAARLAAAIYLTTFIVAGLGTFAVLDAFLALFLAAALAAFYCALEAHDARTRRLHLVLCGAACGGAFLVKGFLALAIPVVVAAPYLALGRRWKTLFASPWLPIAVAAVVVLPWAVLIQLREPDFWRYFFWVEHVQRFTAENAQHAKPFWYYFAWLPLAGWPWILLLPAAVIGLRRGSARRDARADRVHAAARGTGRAELRDEREAARALRDTVRREHDARSAHAVEAGAPSARFIGYLAAWAALPLLFLSLSRGKLPTYLLPCFAPLAILLAVGLERYLAAGGRSALRAGALAVAVAFAALLALLAAAQARVFGAAPFGPGELGKLAGFAAFMTAGGALAAYAAFASAARARLAALAGAGAALFLPLQLLLPGAVLGNVAPASAVARYAAAPSDAIVVSDAPLFGTVAWALNRNDVYVLSPGEIEYGLSYPEARLRLLDAHGLERLIAQSAGRRSVLIVCERSTERQIEHALPRRAERSEHGKVIVWRIPATRSSA